MRYKEKEYTITRFDDMGNNLKTVTVKDNTEYLGGMITGSDVIPYRKESELDRIFENLTYVNPEKTSEEVEIKKIRLTISRLQKKHYLQSYLQARG